VKITYFVHGTTTDNEKGLCTGHAPGELSKLGIQQAKDLGDQVADKKFDRVFCSDLKRAVDSANLGFIKKYDIRQDPRLRECDYGDFTQEDESKVDYKKYVDIKFPNGESLKDVEERIKNFLNWLKKNFDNEHIAIMAHKAPQLALEVLIKNKSWQEAIDEDWRNTKSWQPGWEYIIKE
jgi:alpha-ribazole phosphatase/probable phosphoglycerate mutase